MSTDYNKQASDFLASAKIRIVKTFTGNRKYFPEDKETRDTYNIRIERIEDSTKSFSFNFGDSIHNTELRKTKHQRIQKLKNDAVNDRMLYSIRQI